MKKVLIIFGGESSEHKISCMSAYSVAKNIDIQLFDLNLVYIDLKSNWYEYNDDIKYMVSEDLSKYKIKSIDNIIDYLKQFDVVFPILHGINGEDGKLQGMLDLFNIKYVGCNHLTSSILMDKDISKLIFNSLNISQVPYISINHNELKDITSKIDYPVIVKPANGGSSIGINKANNKKELKRAIKEALQYDSKVIIEKYIKARELEVAVLRTSKEIVISSPGEIKSSNNFYDYEAKYENDASYTIIPNDLDQDILNKIKGYCNILIEKLNIQGLSRIDYFLDDENNLYLNEINTIPGFTDISMYPKLIENVGISYQELITKLLTN